MNTYALMILITFSASPLMGMHFLRALPRLKSAAARSTLRVPLQTKPMRSHTNFTFKRTLPITIKSDKTWWQQSWINSWWYNAKQWAYRLFKPATIMATTTSIAAVATSAQTQEPSSMWRHRAQGKEVDRNDLVATFMHDCKAYEHHNAAIPKHQKNDSTVRIATYNVHSWNDPLGQQKSAKIFDTIKAIKPDILIIQEHGPINNFYDALNDLGYKFYIIGNTGGSSNNLVISKYPLTQARVKAFDIDQKHWGTYYGREKRCFIETIVSLPNNKSITLYGTHLDVWDESETKRTQQIDELVKTTSNKTGNILIGADFNAVRARDYQYEVDGKLVWDLFNEAHTKRTKIPVRTQALEHLEQANFMDSFTRAGLPNPKFTVWSGVAVDFLYVNQQWQLPIKGCYVHYGAASDHLPVIMDVSCE